MKAHHKLAVIAISILAFEITLATSALAADQINVGAAIVTCQTFISEFTYERGPAFDPTGKRLAFLVPEFKVALLDAQTGRIKHLSKVLNEGNLAGRVSLTFSGDGNRLLIRRADGTIDTYSPTTQDIRKLSFTDVVAMSGRGRWILRSVDRQLEVVDTTAAATPIRIDFEWSRTNAVALSADAKRCCILSGYVATSDLLLADEQQTNVWLWTTGTSKPRLLFDANGLRRNDKAIGMTARQYRQLATSLDARTIAVWGTKGDEGFVFIWSDRTGKESFREMRFAEDILDLTMSPDGQLLLIQSANRSTVPDTLPLKAPGKPGKIIESASGKIVATLDGASFNTSYVFAPDGTRLFRKSPDGLEVLDLKYA